MAGVSQDEAQFALTPIAFEILLTLAGGPKHGYGIKLDIETRTAGSLSLGSGTLYQAIQRLERAGMIAVGKATDPAADARRGRHYELSSSGRRALEGELRRLKGVVEYAQSQNLFTDPNSIS
jgi:DNA-binding PadR family transcriptional regulator